MSEVEKMYRTAKVVPSYHYCNDCQYDMRAECPIRCPDNVAVYPPFTAEKQLELIKLLMKREDFSWTITQQGKNTKYAFYVGYEYGSGDFKEFTEALAGIINDLWAMRYLTIEEKQQVKGILE